MKRIVGYEDLQTYLALENGTTYMVRLRSRFVNAPSLPQNETKNKNKIELVLI